MLKANSNIRCRSFTALLGFLLVLLFSACCLQVPVPDSGHQQISAPASGFNRLFERRGDGWTGGDGTVSVLLPDGRTVWLFGDTLLGSVSADDTRPVDTPFVRNSLMVQNGALMETRLRFAGEEPAAFFAPSSADQWFWPGHGIVDGDQLGIFLHRFELTGSGLWDWRWVGNDLASVSLPSLALTGIQPAPSENGIMYGVCLLKADAYVYIYGTADRNHPKEAHLARAPAGRIHGPWSYFSGSSWSDQPTASRSILDGVSTQYSVIQAGRYFYLFTMDGRTAFSNIIVVYRAAEPHGPWQGPLTVYQAPETNTRVAAYNPFAHPQFSEDNHLLLSYNLNHISDPNALYRDASIYRPRFIRVDLSEVDRRFDTDRK
ncbi:MAG: DUF5005 domain-containing protein [Desulfobacteraceae bacterium]|nr:MAG: DUF5005 domain-containing protein [Desulfobacteraceae bacterium]